MLSLFITLPSAAGETALHFQLELLILLLAHAPDLVREVEARAGHHAAAGEGHAVAPGSAEPTIMHATHAKGREDEFEQKHDQDERAGEEDEGTEKDATKDGFEDRSFHF